MIRLRDRDVRRSAAAALAGALVLGAAPASEAGLGAARELADQGRYRAARTAFDTLAPATRSTPGARLLHGVLKFREGSEEEAARIFAALVRTYPNRPEARLNLAVLDAARWGLADAHAPLVTGPADGERARAQAWWALRELYLRLTVFAYGQANAIALAPAPEDVPAGLPPVAPLRTPFSPMHPPGARAQRSGPPDDDGSAASPTRGEADAVAMNAARGEGEVAGTAAAGTHRHAPGRNGHETATHGIVSPGSGEAHPGPRGTDAPTSAKRAAASHLRTVLNAPSTAQVPSRPAARGGDASAGTTSRGPSWRALLEAVGFAVGVVAALGAIAAGVAVLIRGRVGDRGFRRRLQRVAAPLAGLAGSERATDSESIFRPAEKRSRLNALRDRIEARFPLLHVRQAAPAAFGAALAGAGVCWFSMWSLQIPFGWWGVPLSAASGAGAGWYALAWIQSRQEAEFVRQFPEIVDQIVRLSGAGLPPLEAVSAMADDSADPVRPVLGGIRDGLLAGLDAGSTLRTASERVRLGEFTLFAAVIRLQRRAGGGISAAFSNLADTLRERRRSALRAHASTAQSRITLLILGLMPVVVLTAQKFMAPQSVDILFSTESGLSLLRWGVALIVTGILVARWIATRAVR